MKCIKCGTEMGIGQAIKPNHEEDAIYIAPPGYINNDNLELIDVWKCPNCGHSDYIEE